MSRHSSSTRWVTATVLALAAVLVVALDGSAAGTRVLQRTTPGEIEALAMDGPRVAYDVGAGYGAKTRCNTIYVWNVARGTTTRVSGHKTCDADNTSTGAGVRELALAGGRAAWIVNNGGNSESDDYLYTSSVASPHERVVATAFRSGTVGEVLTGDWLGGLVGARSFLAVNHWSTTRTAITSARLERVAARLQDLAVGDATMRAESTDGRQVAVLRGNGTVGLYSTGGGLLRTITPGSATEVAVRGDYLVVLTRARSLEVYNSHSGRRLHTWRVAAGAAHLDVSSGLASYATPHAVHVVRLASGKARLVARAAGEIGAVQLEPVGLAYAIDRPHETGAVAFVPMSRILR